MRGPKIYTSPKSIRRALVREASSASLRSLVVALLCKPSIKVREAATELTH